MQHFFLLHSFSFFLPPFPALNSPLIFSFPFWARSTPNKEAKVRARPAHPLSPLHPSLPPFLPPSLPGLFFFFWGFLCTGMGQILLLRLLQHSHKQSLIVLSIGLVITLSAVMMSFQAVADYLENPDNVLRMSTLCG
jgi:hypothetical protein